MMACAEPGRSGEAHHGKMQPWQPASTAKPANQHSWRTHHACISVGTGGPQPGYKADGSIPLPQQTGTAVAAVSFIADNSNSNRFRSNRPHDGTATGSLLAIRNQQHAFAVGSQPYLTQASSGSSVDSASTGDWPRPLAARSSHSAPASPFRGTTRPPQRRLPCRQEAGGSVLPDSGVQKAALGRAAQAQAHVSLRAAAPGAGASGRFAAAAPHLVSAHRAQLHCVAPGSGSCGGGPSSASSDACLGQLSAVHCRAAGSSDGAGAGAGGSSRSCGPAVLLQPNGDSLHAAHKVPSGDSPYVRAKHVQLVEKDPTRAIALFWAAINAGDRVDSALKDMAIVMKQQGRADEAVEAIRSLRHKCSEAAQESLDNVLLDLFKRCGRLDDQIALLKHKLDCIRQGVAFNGKRTKTARSQGKKFQVSIEQEATRLLGNLGWAYMQQENYSAAEHVYRKALRVEDDPNKACNLGICLMKQGRLEEAKELLASVASGATAGGRGAEAKPLPGAESHLKSFERAQELLQQMEADKENQKHCKQPELDADGGAAAPNGSHRGPNSLSSTAGAAVAQSVLPSCPAASILGPPHAWDSLLVAQAQSAGSGSAPSEADGGGAGAELGSAAPAGSEELCPAAQKGSVALMSSAPLPAPTLTASAAPLAPPPGLAAPAAAGGHLPVAAANPSFASKEAPLRVASSLKPTAPAFLPATRGAAQGPTLAETAGLELPSCAVTAVPSPAEGLTFSSGGVALPEDPLLAAGTAAALRAAGGPVPASRPPSGTATGLRAAPAGDLRGRGSYHYSASTTQPAYYNLPHPGLHTPYPAALSWPFGGPHAHESFHQPLPFPAAAPYCVPLNAGKGAHSGDGQLRQLPQPAKAASGQLPAGHRAHRSSTGPMAERTNRSNPVQRTHSLESSRGGHPALGGALEGVELAGPRGRLGAECYRSWPLLDLGGAAAANTAASGANGGGDYKASGERAMMGAQEGAAAGTKRSRVTTPEKSGTPEREWGLSREQEAGEGWGASHGRGSGGRPEGARVVARSLWDLLGFAGSPDALLHGLNAAGTPGSTGSAGREARHSDKENWGGSGRKGSGGKKAPRLSARKGELQEDLPACTLFADDGQKVEQAATGAKQGSAAQECSSPMQGVVAAGSREAKAGAVPLQQTSLGAAAAAGHQHGLLPAEAVPAGSASPCPAVPRLRAAMSPESAALQLCPAAVPTTQEDEGKAAGEAIALGGGALGATLGERGAGRRDLFQVCNEHLSAHSSRTTAGSGKQQPAAGAAGATGCGAGDPGHEAAHGKEETKQRRRLRIFQEMTVS